MRQTARVFALLCCLPMLGCTMTSRPEAPTLASVRHDYPGAQAGGVGVVIHSSAEHGTWLLTAAHVARAFAPPPTVWLEGDDEPRACEVVAWEHDDLEKLELPRDRYDLALLKVRSEGQLAAVPLGSELIGERVGQFQTMAPDSPEPRRLQVACLVAPAPVAPGFVVAFCRQPFRTGPGMSGSPVLVDGRLAGMFVATVRVVTSDLPPDYAASRAELLVPAGEIRRFLTRHNLGFLVHTAGGEP